jgi:malate dehydrogenase (oxaloacetate-decarboxylating)
MTAARPVRRSPYLATPSHTLTVRLKLARRPGTLARVLGVVARARAAVGAMDLVQGDDAHNVRDLTVQVASEEGGRRLLEALGRERGVEIVHASDQTFLMHLGGKLRVEPKVRLRTRADLSMAYTPGVARVCEAIALDRSKAWNLTIKGNTVAIVSDGTAVLGLGDIGPEAAMPVMEGKAMIFKEFGNVDAFPICLATKSVDGIVAAVKALAPTFGGINLEDISAPRCFEIEERLRRELDIPVFHDDQHGTAIVCLAGMLNALRLVRKDIRKVRIVLAGIGAAGVAVTKILMRAGARNVIGFDRAGALYAGRTENMNPAKEEYALLTNPGRFRGSLREALKGADAFVGLSGPGLLEAKDLARMAKGAIVFAMANPEPEVAYEDAARYAAVVATGRSDYPNQVNNALAFPGIFRGVLDARARTITPAMELAAARAIAGTVSAAELRPEYIIPSLFDARVAPAVARAVRAAASEPGEAVSRRRPRRAGPRRAR